MIFLRSVNEVKPIIFLKMEDAQAKYKTSKITLPFLITKFFLDSVLILDKLQTLQISPKLIRVNHLA